MVFWLAASELGVAVFIYTIASSMGIVPKVSVHAIGSLLFSPLGIGLVAAAGIATAGVLHIRYGRIWDGVVPILAYIAKWDTQDLLLEGRVIYDDVAWHVEFYENDQYGITQRECSFCGRELIESYLPKHIVHGPNSAFDSTKIAERAAADTWEDVLGTEKFEDRDQTLALACPKCNFSVPGQKNLEAGRDAALGEFKHHVERMRSGNPQNDPFASYREQLTGEADAAVLPSDLWDVYVTTEDVEDVLPIGETVSPSATRTSHERSSMAPTTDDGAGTLRS